jgi:anaphase-promoting complex subunit 4
MVEESRLPLQSEKALSYTIKPHLLAYCPRTDLLAVVTQDEVIEVYRIGGQRAFVVKRKGPSTFIFGLKWIRDGWSDYIFRSVLQLTQSQVNAWL